MANFYYLTEGPSVEGLPKGRTPLYVEYSHRGDSLVFRVIEGKTIGTPASYKFHIGRHGSSLDEAKITRFEHSEKETVLDYIWQDLWGRITISNTSPIGVDSYNGIDEKIDAVYNLFGDDRAGDMRPDGCDEFSNDR